MELHYEEGGKPGGGETPRTALAADRGAPGGAGVLPPRAAQRARGAGRARLPARARASTARRPSGSASGFAPRGGEDLSRHLRAKGFTDDEVVARRPVRAGQPRALRPVPRPAGLADPRHHRRHGRVRRPAALRRRPDRGQVPQHLRDPDLQEVDRALRPRPREEVHCRRTQSGHRRGLHRRHGLPARRHRGSRGDVWHGVRRRPHQDAPPDHARRGRPRAGPGHLHLRRRRGRAEGRDAGLRRGPALGVAVVRGGRRRWHGPVRAAHRQG